MCLIVFRIKALKKTVRLIILKVDEEFLFSKTEIFVFLMYKRTPTFHSTKNNGVIQQSTKIARTCKKKVLIYFLASMRTGLQILPMIGGARWSTNKNFHSRLKLFELTFLNQLNCFRVFCDSIPYEL